jgi:putative MFS transporter
MTTADRTGAATAAPAAGRRAPTIAARLDRIPLFSMHRRLAFIVGIGAFFDLYDIFLGGVLAAVLTEQWNLGSTEKALVISSAFAGMFFGAASLGTLADRLGRRRMFLVNLGTYSFFSLLAAFAPNLEWLVVLRFLAGLGLGAELILVDAYLSEVLPNRSRGRWIAWAYTFGFIGVPAVAFLGARFVASEHLLIDGWRWLLVVGSLGSAIVWMLRRRIPESPRWHEVRGEHERAEAATAEMEQACMRELKLRELDPPAESAVEPQGSVRLSDLFHGGYARRTVMLWIFQSLQTVGYYGFGSLAPIVLLGKGYDIVETLGYSAVIFLGYPIGSAISIPLVERIERKWMLVGAALGIAIFGVIFGAATSPALIIAAGFGLTIMSNLLSNAFHIYQAEIYPTRMRGTAIGVAYSRSRIAGAVLPFIAVSTLDAFGATAVFAGSAVIMTILAIDVAWLGPRSTGRSLETLHAAG